MSSNLIHSVVSEIFTFLALLGAEKNTIVRPSIVEGQTLLAVNVSIEDNNIFFLKLVNRVG